MSWWIAALLAACTTGDPDDVGADPDEMDGSGGGGGSGSGSGSNLVPDVRCNGEPAAGPARDFRHLRSDLISEVGGPKHRGIDLVASSASATQTLAGRITYTIIDKDLEDEDVEIFACRGGAWSILGMARTDDNGAFALALTGDARLPIGMRDMFVSVVGDRTGARFLAYVAPVGTRLILSDVDGTLTSSENAFFETIVLGSEPDARAGAARAYAAAAAKGYQMVYMTARGNQYTAETRRWLANQGFPRGPLRLSPSFVTLPGGDTVDYKAQTASALAAAGLELAAGVGNRASDITAYGNAGIAADRIFIEVPEYLDEVQSQLAIGAAISFETYDALRVQHLERMP
jgi:LNS2 (Lipin/Ned1/Smp2)